MKYNNILDYFIFCKKMDIGLSFFRKKNICVERVIFEKSEISEKMTEVERYIENIESIQIKLFYWEQDVSMKMYLSNFDLDFKDIKSYKGRTLPGIILIRMDHYFNKQFIKNLLLCHFNHDFSINPYLSVRPQILIQKNDKKNVILDIYDDRGMYVCFIDSC